MPSTSDFSLFEGGPLLGLLTRTRVLRRRGHDLRRASAIFIAITWLPMLVMQSVERLAGHPIDGVMRDFAVHVRLLVAGPLLLVAGKLLDQRARRVLAGISEDQLVEDPARLTSAVDNALRLRDSRLLEGLLLASSFLVAYAVLGRSSTGVFFVGAVPAGKLGYAGWWYGLVALPLFLFVGVRILSRWVIWCRCLWQIARMPLRLSATHPDRVGGLIGISQGTVVVALMTLAASSVAAAGWENQILSAGADVKSFAPGLGVLLAVALLLALAPLVAFCPHLLSLRRLGRQQYGSLALDYSRRFHQRWIGRPPGAELLGTPDIQSLADMGNGFRTVTTIRVIPILTEDLVQVLAAVCIPMLPLVLSQIPLSVLLKKVLLNVLG